MKQWGIFTINSLNKNKELIMNVGLGTASFGTTIPQQKCNQLIETFLDLGGRYIDTANNYAFWAENAQGGESETALGNWLKQSSNNREKILLHSKIGALPLDGKSLDNVEGLSKNTVLNAVESCLKRLQTEYLDVLYLHMPDPNTPLEETLSTLATLIKAGKIKEYGISNYALDEVTSIQHLLTQQNSLVSPSFAQYRHSLLEAANAEQFGVQKFYSEAMKNAFWQINPKIKLVGYSVLLDGLYEQETISKESLYYSESNIEKLKQIRQQAQQLNATPSAVVIKQLADSNIMPLTMTSNVQRLKDNLKLVVT